VDGKEQVFDWFVQFALRSPCIRTEEEEEEEAKKALDVYSRSISRLFSQARMDLYAVKCCCWITKEAQTDDGQLFKKKRKIVRDRWRAHGGRSPSEDERASQSGESIDMLCHQLN
jgi:hypothetical protein